ncbi:hypothetical protein L873DRAFT_1942078 [Choiromyces venosus 120613-1]|uniref:Uncharacterized protein n=1 Tax=Choiromyces venosus 120613-1 TaxID=1336337 RepID=A0A3N4JII2_9PEZI|nr:hypothetical protein L873DRAFT_1942078 [Choiromyces venosus 120613-1]
MTITNYWRGTYRDSPNNDIQQNQFYTIDGIQQRIKNALSSRSAHSWLTKLGWNWKEVRKAVYKDGHECPNIQQYRQNIFLPQMEPLKPYMME